MVWFPCFAINPVTSISGPSIATIKVLTVPSKGVVLIGKGASFLHTVLTGNESATFSFLVQHKYGNEKSAIIRLFASILNVSSDSYTIIKVHVIVIG